MDKIAKDIAKWEQERDLDNLQGGDNYQLRTLHWIERASEAGKSIAKIMVKGNTVGTGFWAEFDGTKISGTKFVTAAHVIDEYDLDKIEIRFEHSKIIYTIDIDFFSPKKKLDVAICSLLSKCKRCHLGEITPLKLATNPLPDYIRTKNGRRKPRVVVAGYPDGTDLHFSYIDSKYQGSKNERIYYDAHTLHGMSGGPVFNEELKVIGIHRGGDTLHKASIFDKIIGGKHRYNRGTSIEWILKQLKTEGSELWTKQKDKI